ncbi:hypothetical protein GCM10007857_79480 [Bradyrhizobium iriomotense]|uniref:Uncharacterized protein n=1 Tax=Bradyrhizobium iriomotense TaxID=441950 RepID=A0ABQ6BCJ9_9BRAD|nr:hypothetical protein GCM10007857_79480 [Bradyrhizobium iriomotense]
MLQPVGIDQRADMARLGTPSAGAMCRAASVLITRWISGAKLKREGFGPALTPLITTPLRLKRLRETRLRVRGRMEGSK